MNSYHIPSLLRKITTKRALRFVIPVAVVLVLAGVVLLQQTVLSTDAEAGSTAATKQHKEQLHDQVTNQDGTPGDGRDPASQYQHSLSDAASRPSGSSQRHVDAPAAGVTHDHHNH